jgi:hypothetical protein
MPDPATYERLQLIGSFGLSETKTFEMFKQKLTSGYRRKVLVGSRAGELSWKLTFKVLPDTQDSQVQTNQATLESRANYLWNFFCRSKTGYTEIDRPFIVTSPRDGLDYLAVFSDDVMSYQMFMNKLYSSDLALEQVRVRGVNSGGNDFGDGSNPDRI